MNKLFNKLLEGDGTWWQKDEPKINKIKNKKVKNSGFRYFEN